MEVAPRSKIITDTADFLLWAICPHLIKDSETPAWLGFVVGYLSNLYLSNLKLFQNSENLLLVCVQFRLLGDKTISRKKGSSGADDGQETTLYLGWIIYFQEEGGGTVGQNQGAQNLN